MCREDYASIAADSKVRRHIASESCPEHHLEASPTWSHRFLAGLWRQKLLQHWVQQNHDGLPQKAPRM